MFQNNSDRNTEGEKDVNGIAYTRITRVAVNLKYHLGVKISGGNCRSSVNPLSGLTQAEADTYYKRRLRIGELCELLAVLSSSRGSSNSLESGRGTNSWNLAWIFRIRSEVGRTAELSPGSPILPIRVGSCVSRILDVQGFALLWGPVLIIEQDGQFDNLAA
jgi:hypothetical protein